MMNPSSVSNLWQKLRTQTELMAGAVTDYLLQNQIINKSKAQETKELIREQMLTDLNLLILRWNKKND